jgi:FlaG/FlaF family flagellin (archaellin)
LRLRFPRRSGLARVVLWATLAALLLGPFLPSAVAVPVAAGTSAPASPAIPVSSISNEYVTWNGANVSKASGESSAFTVSTGSTVLVLFHFTSIGGPNVSARLQAYYFGAAISSSSVLTTVAPTGAGLGTMNWSFGDYTYVLQGLFHLTVSLVYTSNGSAAWSESFWIVEQAPYRIVSGFTIFLLGLGAAELYGIATAGRRVRRPPAPPQTWQGPAAVTNAPPPAGTSEEPPTPADSSPPPMPTPAPPPEGSP